MRRRRRRLVRCEEVGVGSHVAPAHTFAVWGGNGTDRRAPAQGSDITRPPRPAGPGPPRRPGDRRSHGRDDPAHPKVRAVNNDRRRRLLALADRLGTPGFVYFLDDARARIAAVRQAFGGAFAITYAIKANPAPALLRGLRGAVDGLDVSSGGELARALAAGYPAAAIHFTGPGKRPAELAAAVAAGVGAVVL
ncbi:MAG: hypothetical protein FJ306_16005, partial [Planctomycetes bacterium]|nr:hypothetical protein [Planctomycetota bacterium]